MPDLNSILLTLNLKEPNIHFDEKYIFQEKIKGVESLVFSGTLTSEPPEPRFFHQPLFAFPLPEVAFSSSC